jgi:hypothetical protein
MNSRDSRHSLEIICRDKSGFTCRNYEVMVTVTGIIGMLTKNISIERRLDHDSCGDFTIFRRKGYCLAAS